MSRVCVCVYSHVPEGDLSQQQEANGIRLRRVAVVCALGHHVGKVHTLAEHVTGLRGEGKIVRHIYARAQLFLCTCD